MEDSVEIACPYCFQFTAIQIGEGAGRFELVEDCQVCCHPIIITLQGTEDGIQVLNVSKELE